KAVTKNKFFWTFAIGYSIIAISISALSTQYATYFTGELGLSATLVGTLGSLFALFCLIGNVTGGVLFDKIGTVKTMTISMTLGSIAIIAMLLAKQIHGFAFLFSIAYGLNVYSYMSAPAFMATDVFGKKESSAILGTISLLFALGFAFGSTLFGMVVDNFGFNAAWILMLVCILSGYGLLLTSIKKVKAQNAEYERTHNA
ncbi:MAG: MFS transporter, partial [Peptostreptococcaceae bacterium]